jgi:hypothetical protein
MGGQEVRAGQPRDSWARPIRLTDMRACGRARALAEPLCTRRLASGRADAQQHISELRSSLAVRLSGSVTRWPVPATMTRLWPGSPATSWSGRRQPDGGPPSDPDRRRSGGPAAWPTLAGAPAGRFARTAPQPRNGDAGSLAAALSWAHRRECRLEDRAGPPHDV